MGGIDMYLDYILFAAGGVLLFASLVLFFWLLRSKKRSRDYQRILRDETQRIDVMGTLRKTELLSTRASSSTGGEATELMSESPTELMTEAPTELMTEDPRNMGTGTASLSPTVGAGLDLSVLEGKYELIREIHGGGMSRIFLARHKILGNEWIVKYVEGNHAELANEAEVLKKLNHISLPQIIDIFQSQQGTFLVERFVEGYSLDKAFELEAVGEGLICDWALQLSQVLHYLHTLETPIIHCDMKPSNVMVTHDNRLVLIDFGISKRQGVDEKQSGLTYRYAAPEQFKPPLDKGATALRRFGTLPPGHTSWPIDPRTDLYSVGVILFELATGDIPRADQSVDLRKIVSPALAAIIEKCVALDPADRYQSAQELTQALEQLKGRQATMARALTLRRVAAVCCAVSLLAGAGTTASAAYINQQESLSIVDMDPGRAVVTAQQSVQLLLQKTMPNGEVVTLEPSQIQWSYSEDNIARLDGDRLVGLNVGETTLYGKYRNKVVSLNVTVTEPVKELVDIALRYPVGTQVSLYAGDGRREHLDGPLTGCSFFSPEGLSADGDTLYVTDSGVIRMIEGNEVSSLYMEPDYLTADLVRGWNGELYILTGPWTDEDEISYYGILRVSEESAEFLYYTEAAWSVISDFAFSSDGKLWYVQQNMGTGATTLNTLDTDTLEVAWVMDLPDSTTGMAFDGEDNLYLAVPEAGTILRVNAGATEWRYFAGVEGSRNFVDGAIPQFYRPTSLVYWDNALYVLDFDTVRKITIEGEGALFTETLAGLPTADTNPEITLGDGTQSVFSASELATLSRDSQGRLLLTDPKNAAIYQIF